MAGVNKIIRSVNPVSVFPSARSQTDATVTYLQGDLLCLLSGLIQKPSAEADGATFLGIASESITLGKLASPYSGTAVDSAQAITDIPGPVAGVVARVLLKSGDSLVAGGLVYLDPVTGSRNVQAAGTKAIGVYQGAAVTAGASTEVEVLLGHRFPGDTLVVA